MAGESEALASAVDAAFTQQIAKIFAVFCSASEEEISSGTALERYSAGMRRALDRRAEARSAIVLG
jgi:hypothetical protein